MKKLAFTMAEILLSLTIIGVVAAITLPSLMGNINERTWNTQRKALNARMSQAIAMMPQLNGYGTYIADTKDAAGSVTSSGIDTAAEAFLTEGLSKVLKINNICDNENLVDCGVPTTLVNHNGSVSLPTTLAGLQRMFSSVVDTKAAAFETQNGESIVVYYNPNCQSDLEESSYSALNKTCANFIYDLNGNKGPNTIGKDMGFITALYSTDSVVVAPMYAWVSELSADEYRVPNIHEAISFYINELVLFSVNLGSDYMASSSRVSGGDVDARFCVGVGNANGEVMVTTGCIPWYVKR